MALFVRVVEGDDGRWTCRQGRFDTDSHDHFAEALSHASEIAAAIAPAEIFVHRLDGSIERFGQVD